MFMHKTMTKAAFAAALALSFPVAAAESLSPHLGQPVTEADIAAWNIDIAPDGTGLPSGSGNAVEGEFVYVEKCATCHGFEGAGTPADTLAGGVGSLASDKPLKTVGSFWPYATTLFDFIRRSMPLNEPQTLPNDDVYALTAYILKLNGIVKDTEAMNAKSLPKVKMPNRDGFFQVYPGNLK